MSEATIRGAAIPAPAQAVRIAPYITDMRPAPKTSSTKDGIVPNPPL